MNVIEYVTEEVKRQRHDVLAIEGIERVSWMLMAWCSAIRKSENRNLPTMKDILYFGAMIETEHNEYGFRRVPCRTAEPWEIVFAPPVLPNQIVEKMERLLELMPSMTPLEFYREFELIHPFYDGNGRTGKILLNWLNNTLLNPVFPPDDFWGQKIRNP